MHRQYLFSAVCSGRKAAGARAAPAPRVGAFAPNPEFDVVSFYSVGVSCLRCAKKLATDEESIVVYEAFNLARTTSSDADAPASELEEALNTIFFDFEKLHTYLRDLELQQDCYSK